MFIPTNFFALTKSKLKSNSWWYEQTKVSETVSYLPLYIQSHLNDIQIMDYMISVLLLVMKMLWNLGLSQRRGFCVLSRMNLWHLTLKTGIGHALSKNCYMKLTQRKLTTIAGNQYLGVLWTIWRLAKVAEKDN